MHKYRLVAKKGEGTFSEVLKAQCIKNGKYVAIKCMKNHFDSLDQVNNLREIQALRRLSPHANIIKLQEVLYDQPTGRLALVFELMDMNIYELIRGRRHYVAEERVKNYMYQLMKAMDHMHRNGIFHRDIKPENILIMDDCLKLADFGSCRGIYSKQPYTEYISTRWYRAPECLLTDGYYNYKMDMWGVGCVFFEIVSLFPLFPGTNELDQIQKIHNILGTPPPELLAKMKKRSQHMDFNFPPKEGTGIAKLIPHVSPDCVDLIVKLLAYNPDDRLSARQALRHPYFRELREAEKRQKALMTPDLASHFSNMAAPGGGAGPASQGAAAAAEASETGGKPSRHQASPNSTAADLQGTGTPGEGGRANGDGGAGLPHISKGSHSHGHGQHASMHGGHGHSEHAGGGGGGGGYSGYRAGGGGGGTTSDAADDSGTDGGSYRLPGLHTQNSMENLAGGGDDGSLPPIGNMSLGKGSTARRAAAVAAGMGAAGSHGYDMSGYKSGNKSVASMVGVPGAGAAGIAAKRQGMPPPVKYASSSKPPGQGGFGAGQGAVAGHKLGGQVQGQGGVGSMADIANMSQGAGASNYKYSNKANAAKGNAKYVSPYSLRQLAGVGAAGVPGKE